MAADVPVMAYEAGAVPETLGGAGVTFAPRTLEYAQNCSNARYDDGVRSAIIQGPAPATGALCEEPIGEGSRTHRRRVSVNPGAAEESNARENRLQSSQRYGTETPRRLR